MSTNLNKAERNRVKYSEYPGVHWVSEDFEPRPIRAALFDFDGTLSLLRRNWQATMVPLMVRELRATETDESDEALTKIVEEFVTRLTGRQTIYQMIQLCTEVESRGGTAKTPLEYKEEYHEALWQQVYDRVEGVRAGRVSADQMMVPNSRKLLERLADADVALFLASGTDLVYVRDEVDVLGLTAFFGDHIYGALDNYQEFSKAKIIQKMISESGFDGAQIIGFGDGFVEIEEIKRVGGLAIGVASDEDQRRPLDAWKKERLIRAGADIIIGDYQQADSLFELIGIR